MPPAGRSLSMPGQMAVASPTPMATDTTPVVATTPERAKVAAMRAEGSRRMSSMSVIVRVAG